MLNKLKFTRLISLGLPAVRYWPLILGCVLPAAVSAATSNSTVTPITNLCQLQSCTITMSFTDGGSIRSSDNAYFRFGEGASITLGDGGSYDLGSDGTVLNSTEEDLFSGSAIDASTLLILSSEGYIQLGIGGEIKLGHGGNISYAESSAVQVTDASTVTIISDEGGEVSLFLEPETKFRVIATRSILIKQDSSVIKLSASSIGNAATTLGGLRFSHSTGVSSVDIQTSTFINNNGDANSPSVIFGAEGPEGPESIPSTCSNSETNDSGDATIANSNAIISSPTNCTKIVGIEFSDFSYINGNEVGSITFHPNGTSTEIESVDFNTIKQEQAKSDSGSLHYLHLFLLLLRFKARRLN